MPNDGEGYFTRVAIGCLLYTSNYRTEETPTDSTNINNGHKYTYDANGNLVYINTSRVKKDGKEDEKATEQKYRWDEENRLLAADENGFVCLLYTSQIAG